MPNASQGWTKNLCFIYKAIPVKALNVPEGYGSMISRESAHDSGKVVTPTHRPPLTPGSIPGTHFVRGCVDPRVIVRPKRLSR
jgi:hypothetical protein